MSERPADQEITKSYYEKCAEAYAAKTLRMSLDNLWDSFAERLGPGAEVLDVGCGAGRDLRELGRRGLRVLGLDYSAPLVAIAREYSGEEVVLADLREVEFAEGRFEGIWAVASLLHMTRAEVPVVLRRLWLWLRPGGLLLTSMMRGRGEEIGKDGRQFVLYQPEEWEALLRAAGFTVDAREETVARNETGGRTAGEVMWLVTIAHKVANEGEVGK